MVNIYHESDKSVAMVLNNGIWTLAHNVSCVRCSASQLGFRFHTNCSPLTMTADKLAWSVATLGIAYNTLCAQVSKGGAVDTPTLEFNTPTIDAVTPHFPVYLETEDGKLITWDRKNWAYIIEPPAYLEKIGKSFGLMVMYDPYSDQHLFHAEYAGNMYMQTIDRFAKVNTPYEIGAYAAYVEGA